MAKTGETFALHANFRFTVAIDKVKFAAFTECSLPNLQVETLKIKEGGQNEYEHTLPVRVNVGTITLRRGIVKDNALLDWYLQVMQGDIEAATRTVTVTMHDSELNPFVTWEFLRAYPIKWSGPTLKTGDQAVAIEVLELAHHGFLVSKSS